MRDRVVAVIAARNEENTIQQIIESTQSIVNEVVVVDGHSTDRTRQLAQEAGATVLLDHGKGKGDGLRTAIQQLDCDVLVFLDADGSHDPCDIPKLVQPI